MKEQIIAILLPVLGLLAEAGRRWLKVKLASPKLAGMVDLARIAVTAAEKWGEDNSVAGVEKYKYADMVLRSGAKRLGVKVTDEEANAFVHAALAEMEGFFPKVQDLPDAA